ncbi:hypothetical protein BD324DRAFT_154943 [Kockovaella imperatae]|uniref:Ubiquitin-like protease family profile domain-containing protein n=1 Tax=Kockovaella imperatae TaxID=4999 RepID=A0A1Y1U8Y8_9TREE|nr:hypothetical protein BD324DRAFT_154943 [Kockovaella imperatae]ORX34500.1 hypothetical protein BD324DRAFT_154943 [Kockovaella imperatae]
MRTIPSASTRKSRETMYPNSPMSSLCPLPRRVLRSLIIPLTDVPSSRSPAGSAIVSRTRIFSTTFLSSSGFVSRCQSCRRKFKLKGGPKADPDSETLPPWPGYDAVKKWTKKANIFDKDFLIVPINEDYHWYLAVIYRPRGFLQQAKSVETLEKDEPDEKGSTDERGKSEPVDPDDSIDPIDSLHGPMDIDEASNEIQSLTLSAQGSPEKPTNDDVEMDDQAKSSDEKPNWPILDGDDCWIFTFDSLGGSHKAVLSHLNRYLLYEAHDKGRLTGLSLNAGRYVEAKVPGQPNFSDCGLFLVHYASQLLKHTEETLRFLQRPPPRYKAPNRLAWEQDMKTVWREDETKAMRQAWLQDIDDITGIWNSIQGIKPEEPIATAPAQMVPEIPPPSLPPQLSQQRTVSTRRRTESPIKQRDPVTETRHLSVPLNSDPANSNLAPELFNLSRSRQATSPPSRSRSRSHSRTMSAAIDPELYESEVPEPVEDRVEDAAESRARSTSMSDYDEEDNFVGSPLDNLGGQRSTPSNGIYHSSPHRSNRVAGSRLGQSRIPSYDDRAERSVSTEEEQEPVEPRDGDLVDSTEITPRPAMRASSLDPSRRTGIPLITYSSRSKRPAEPSPVNQRKHPRLSEPPSDIDPDIMRADEDVQHHLPVPPAKPGHSRSASDQAPLAPDPATGKSVEAAILVDSSDEE